MYDYLKLVNFSKLVMIVYTKGYKILNYKVITVYALFRISSKLMLCEEKINYAYMFGKNIFFYFSYLEYAQAATILRERFIKHYKLISRLPVAKQSNELFMKNHRF